MSDTLKKPAKSSISSKVRWWAAFPALCLVAAAAGTSTSANAAGPAQPALNVTVVQDGLNIPWDIAFLPAVGSAIPKGTMLYTERTSKKLTMKFPNGQSRKIFEAPAGMWAAGETGLMGVTADRDFAKNRSFVTCHGYKSGSTQDVRVVRWQFNTAFTQATPVKNLLTGLPSSTGRHGGCALLQGAGQALYVGTGDSAVGVKPQSLTSAGGKVMKIDIATGAKFSTNPFATSKYDKKTKVVTYGHRNVQGLAYRTSKRTIYSVEQGSYRDDEVNVLRSGGNYGWNPVPRKSGDASYNEGSNSPMTDHTLPGTQRNPVWKSGTSTIAASGGDFVYGSAWGGWSDSLAVAALKDQSIRFLKFDTNHKLTATWKPAILDHNPEFGRLRAAVMGPDGSLYVTTSNSKGDDKILKVTPTAP